MIRQMIFFKILFPIALALLFYPSLGLAEMGKQVPFHLEQKGEGKLSPRELNAQVEQALLDQTNDYRKKKKRKPLSPNSLLKKAALDHSADMKKRNYLSHFSPEGKAVMDRLERYAKIQTDLGENLHTIRSSQGLTDPQAIAAQMMKDWEGSPTHRDNLLSKKFTQLGVGCVTDGFQIFCTQVFSGPDLPAR
jgi:uncharacterized protein YkwD